MSGAGEASEFYRTAARAIGQRQLMLALLNLPRDLDDKQLAEQFGARILHFERIELAARTLATAAIANVETQGRSWHVQRAHIRELSLALALPDPTAPDSARKDEPLLAGTSPANPPTTHE